jgi:hypothetical protein
MRMRRSWALFPALALAACDETIVSKADAAKIAATEAAKAVKAAPEEKGRWQIVNGPYLGNAILLDTASGQSFRPCNRGELRRGNSGGEMTAWCEMVRGEYEVPEPTATPTHHLPSKER